MLLRNLHAPDSFEFIQILIRGEKINTIQSQDSPFLEGSTTGKSKESWVIDFNGALVFPGLINSHDHIDFNLFPSFQGGPYQNYTEWGEFIHRNYKSEIERILRIPERLRKEWGYYKNLVAGITTVVNHGIKLHYPCEFLNVFEDLQSIHSVQFDKYWKSSLNNIFKIKKRVAIHIGEGIDILSKKEIDQVIHHNFLRRDLVGIHGIGMNVQQAGYFKALVWCPESNFFLFNTTAPIHQLKERTNILFGTDSTLTGRWNIWDHIRLARKTGMLSDLELFNSLTFSPGHFWGLNTGKVQEHAKADLIISKRSGYSFEDFFSINPEDIHLIIQAGRMVLFDSILLDQMNTLDLASFTKIRIKESTKYVIGNLPALMHKIRCFDPGIVFPFSDT